MKLVKVKDERGSTFTCTRYLSYTEFASILFAAYTRNNYAAVKIRLKTHVHKNAFTHSCTISFDQRLINYKYNDKQRLDCAKVLLFNLTLL